MSKPRFSPRKEIKNRSFEGLLWGPAQNNKLVGPQARPRTSLSKEMPWPRQSLFRPTRAKRTCPRSNSSSDTTKSRSKVRPNHCSPPSKYIKGKETQNISAKAATTTLNVSQLLSWLHLMKRRPLNSATLATVTHKKLIMVSDGIGAQVGVWMINKCKAQMIGEGLYNM